MSYQSTHGVTCVCVYVYVCFRAAYGGEGGVSWPGSFPDNSLLSEDINMAVPGASWEGAGRKC